MQWYKYKHGLIDTDLLDYYHIINVHIQLRYTTKSMRYSDYTRPPEGLSGQC